MARRFSLWHRCPPGADLSPYCDGELPVRKRARIAAHLKDCAVCRRELDALTALSRDVGAAFREVAQAAALPGRDMSPWPRADAVHLTPREGRRHPGLLRRAAALVAAVCLLIGAVWFLWPGAEVSEPERAAAQPSPFEAPEEGPVTAKEAEPAGISVTVWRPLRADVCALALAGDPEARAQMELLGLDGKLLAAEPMRLSEASEPVALSDLLLEEEIRALWHWRFTGERL